MAQHSTEYDRQDFKSVALYMRRTFGTDIFREPSRMYAVFFDLSPSLKPYGNVMRQLAERGALAELEISSHDGGIRQDRAIMKVRYILETELLLGVERADYFLDVLRTIYGAKIVKRGECGDNVTYTLDEDGVLTIIPLQDVQIYLPGFSQEPMPMWNVEYEEDIPWVNEREMISHVEIQKGVTTIGAFAFESCPNLKSVYISDSVTSIEECAFKDCVALKSVQIPNSVTYIGGWVFDSCKGLTSVNIPDSVISTGEFIFKECTGLTNVTIPNSMTSTGKGTFYGCMGLTSVTIPNSVKVIGGRTFEYCIGLKSVHIPDSVTYIDGLAFAGCTGLTNVTIPESVSYINTRAFHDCAGLKSVSVSAKAEIGFDAFPDSVIVTRRP